MFSTPRTSDSIYRPSLEGQERKKRRTSVYVKSTLSAIPSLDGEGSHYGFTAIFSIVYKPEPESGGGRTAHPPCLSPHEGENICPIGVTQFRRSPPLVRK